MNGILTQPWPWYITGPLIGLMVPLLLLAGNKQFGISSSFRHICAALVPVKTDFFRYDWKKESWMLFLAAGIILGGYMGGNLFGNPNPVRLSDATVQDLLALGISEFTGLAPAAIFSTEYMFTLKGIVFVLLGGFLVGFGTRWANGCTSGHAIMGLSLLNAGSLLAVVGFFVGGLIVTHLLFPFLLTL